MLGDYQRAHEVGAGEPDLGGYLNALALVMLGREQEAVANCGRSRSGGRRRAEKVQRVVADAVGRESRRRTYRDADDSRVWLPRSRVRYVIARQFALLRRLGRRIGPPRPRRRGRLLRLFHDGSGSYGSIRSRADPAFTKILRHAEVRHREALAAFVQADGERLLGLKVSR